MSRSSTEASASRRARGFSLLEVLVAFVVLALSLGVIMRIFSTGMSRVGESEAYARAVMLADAKLAQVGADIALDEGEVDGETEDAFRWRVRVTPFDADRPAAQAQALGQDAAWPSPARLLQVEVEVSWAALPTVPRSIRLVTLRHAPRSVQ